MTKSLIILGRQPELGLAELESLFGADKLGPIGKQAVILDIEPGQISIDRLGGALRVCKVLTQLDTTDWGKLSSYLVEHVPKHTCCIGPGKLIFGISAFGLKANQKAIERTGLEVKKAVRASDGRSVRVVPTKGTELSSAQVLHNKMTQPQLGMELFLVAEHNKTWLCQTTAVQNIDAYSARDQARPKRDARVGMLPPKLAQIIINLATNQKIAQNHSPVGTTTVLDPFCGTGVILQEALLAGFNAVGYDIEPRMVEYSIENLEWLLSDPNLEGSFTVETGDATTSKWTSFNTIAAETYLGRPFSIAPNSEVLGRVIQDVNTIHKKFLQNVVRQTEPGFRMCIAVPAWFRKLPHSDAQTHGEEILHLPVLDHITDMGYTRVSFVHAEYKALIYHREGQIVGRELVVLTRK